MRSIDRLALGDQAGDHQARRRAQVGRHHGRARELVDALHDRDVAVDLDLRAQAHQLVDVHEAVLEDRLGDRRRAVGDAVEHHELRLHVGRERRVLAGANARPRAAWRRRGRGSSRRRPRSPRRPRAACRSPPRGGRRARGAARRRRRPPRPRTGRCRPRCGRGRCGASTPCSRSTPSMRMRLVPWPSIRAPIAISISARSGISGSCAAFSSTVSPSASVAAISRFSVPVTVTMSVVMRAPFRRLALGDDVAVLDDDLGAHRLQALDVLVDRPRADRAAAGQRDARLAEARQQRARARGSTRASSSTSSYGASGEVTSPASSVSVALAVARPSRATTPRLRSSLRHRRHVAAGAARWRAATRSAVSSAAHSSGSAAFLAPEMTISPASRRPPRMRSWSMCCDGASAASGRVSGCWRYSAGVSVFIDSAWICSRMRSPRAR